MPVKDFLSQKVVYLLRSFLVLYQFSPQKQGIRSSKIQNPIVGISNVFFFF